MYFWVFWFSWGTGRSVSGIGTVSRATSRLASVYIQYCRVAERSLAAMMAVFRTPSSLTIRLNIRFHTWSVMSCRYTSWLWNLKSWST